MNAPDFWSDTQKAQTVTREINSLKQQLEKDEKLKRILDDLETYKVLLEEEFSDELFHEAKEKLQEYIPQVEEAEIQFLLNGKTDRNNAILTIHPGAGGTESQDWAEMLLRMYSRWAEKMKFKTEIVDYLPGDEAGLKSVTMEVMGEFAYGYLKSEIGVHRLVRHHSSSHEYRGSMPKRAFSNPKSRNRHEDPSFQTLSILRRTTQKRKRGN